MRAFSCHSHFSPFPPPSPTHYFTFPLFIRRTSSRLAARRDSRMNHRSKMYSHPFILPSTPSVDGTARYSEAVERLGRTATTSAAARRCSPLSTAACRRKAERCARKQQVACTTAAIRCRRLLSTDGREYGGRVRANDRRPRQRQLTRRVNRPKSDATRHGTDGSARDSTARCSSHTRSLPLSLPLSLLSLLLRLCHVLSSSFSLSLARSCTI